MKRMLRIPSLAILCLWLSLAPLAAKDKKKTDAKKEDAKLSEKTFKGLSPRGIGPALMSGRIADIAIHPKDQSTWYVAVGSGGVWKTTNAATTWTPIFDDQGSYSIGCVTIDPNRPEIIWVGTGENVGGRHVGYGDGIYRSLDGGSSWENLGLKKSEHIGNIIVHPEDSNTLYVAVQGPLWSPGGERGLYKTTDGGKEWKKILGEGEYVGVNEVRMDPRDPDVLYAATHQRFRNVAALINGGPGSGIHKSTDGGQTWRQLKAGLPKEDMGKIGLAISPQNPDVIYATIEAANEKGGFFRSSNAGGSWEKRNDYHSGGTGPHYYQEIFASPHQFDRVYQMDARMRITEDGGKTFTPMNEENKHGDNHAMAFDPGDPEYLLLGTDGGLYESWDLGKSWKFVANLPVTQFYKVAVDYDEPFYNLYGGTQDNNTQGGPSRTDNVSGIRNSDWFITLFGDGHQPAVDPTNPDIVYSEWQQGNLVRYDRKTAEIVYIQPQPEKGDPPERWNWDSPILISPHDPARLYFASQRVWRSDDRGDSWRPVSGDLSRGLERLTLPMMGRTWSVDANWDLFAMSNFGNVTSLAESPLVEGLLYAGTDDGLVQVSEDGGQNWRRIDVSAMPGVPEMSFVNDIKADLHNADTLYVALDNHKAGDFRPFLMKSADRGATWTSITGDLPERHLIWRMVQDHVDANLLFTGTEFGIFFTVDGGNKWVKLSGGVPNIPFRDLAIQKRENDLVGATFGRGFYILDDYSPLRGLNEEKLKSEALLFPVKDAWWYVEKRTLGRGAKASQGDAFYTAPNPPFGAVFTYYLAEGFEPAGDLRRKKEKELAKEGKGAAFPGWDALREEDREDEPAIVLTVRDSDGGVVRRLTGPAKSGFHRVAWDLRYPYLAAWRAGGPRDNFLGTDGWLAGPGAYSVQLAKRIDGVLTDLGQPQSFEVRPLPGNEHALPAMKPSEVAGFLKKLGELQRAITASNEVMAALGERIRAIKEALGNASATEPNLYQTAVGLEKRLYELREMLMGDRPRNRMGEPSAPGIMGRYQVVSIGNIFSTFGPTATHLANYQTAAADMATLRAALHQMRDQDLPALEQKLDAAKVLWTPGRDIPKLP